MLGGTTTGGCVGVCVHVHVHMCAWLRAGRVLGVSAFLSFMSLFRSPMQNFVLSVLYLHPPGLLALKISSTLTSVRFRVAQPTLSGLHEHLHSLHLEKNPQCDIVRFPMVCPLAQQ